MTFRLRPLRSKTRRLSPSHSDFQVSPLPHSSFVCTLVQVMSQLSSQASSSDFPHDARSSALGEAKGLALEAGGAKAGGQLFLIPVAEAGAKEQKGQGKRRGPENSQRPSERRARASTSQRAGSGVLQLSLSFSASEHAPALTLSAVEVARREAMSRAQESLKARLGREPELKAANGSDLSPSKAGAQQNPVHHSGFSSGQEVMEHESEERVEQHCIRLFGELSAESLEAFEDRASELFQELAAEGQCRVRSFGSPWLEFRAHSTWLEFNCSNEGLECRLESSESSRWRKFIYRLASEFGLVEL